MLQQVYIYSFPIYNLLVNGLIYTIYFRLNNTLLIILNALRSPLLPIVFRIKRKHLKLNGSPGSSLYTLLIVLLMYFCSLLLKFSLLIDFPVLLLSSLYPLMFFYYFEFIFIFILYFIHIIYLIPLFLNFLLILIIQNAFIDFINNFFLLYLNIFHILFLIV